MMRSAVVLLAAMNAGCALSWNDCEHTASRDLDLDAGDITTLEVVARAGALDIRGEADARQVVVRGKACAASAESLAQIRLVERREGDRLVVTAELPENDGGWGSNDYSSLDLTLTVPSRVALKVSDSSGAADIRHVTSAEVEDSSGELRLSDIAGDVTVADTSGVIVIERIGGNVMINSDGSGGIQIEDVAGNAVIREDGSGEIEFRQVRGDAIVEKDGSGSISFVAIGGNARVDEDGSGSIEANDIGRDFVVGRDGSGGIDHANVRGSVRIPED